MIANSNGLSNAQEISKALVTSMRTFPERTGMWKKDLRRMSHPECGQHPKRVGA